MMQPEIVNMMGSSASVFQSTLAKAFECSGVGLHSGLTTHVRVLPAPPDQGRVFVRVDLPDAPIIPAQVEAVSQTTLSTELAQGAAKVRTIEHLLSALFALGVDNARIEIDGPEVPLLDGSALEWAKAIAQAGLVTQAAARPTVTLNEPVWVRQGDAFVAALPSSEMRFTYGIDFELPAIGNQWHSWSPRAIAPDQDLMTTEFVTDIAPARTFGLAHQIEQLQASGLIKGGTLENALVCGAEGWLNPPLRFSNEPVRHKLLDLVGDVSLLGTLPQLHVVAYKASHQLHVQLARSLMKGLVAQ